MFERMIREQIIKAICDSTTLVLISLADDEIIYTDDHSFLDFEINTHVLDRKAMDYRQVNITGFVYNKGVKIISVRVKKGENNGSTQKVSGGYGCTLSI